MEEMNDERVNAVTCTAWVPKGVAKHDPEKVEITKEELAKIIKTTSENLEELERLEESDYSDLEVEALEEDHKIPHKKNKKSEKRKNNDVEMKEIDEEKENGNVEEMDEFVKKYNFDTYDSESDGLENLMKLEKLAVHADNADDPNINEEDEEDASSEIENNKIYPTDNLITVGHIDGDAAILEVYGNLVAIGSMSPIIEVWDLDVIDCLEPAYTLGQKPKKKTPRVGHSDAVLCLGWNKDLDHILASGSADKSIIIWDLQECKEGQKFSEFTGAVQDLKWHPKENHFLLAGSCDKTVRLFDCLSNKNSKSWKLDGEVESVVWDPCVNPSFNFVAGTDRGSVYVIDSLRRGFEDRLGLPVSDSEEEEDDNEAVEGNSSLNYFEKSASTTSSNWKPKKKSKKKKGGHLDRLKK
ncbi:Periodic tryptophan protein 1-like protein [Armadillidium nasatum]|uniref:Periodic tryptophan protein 1-like protein n=1 Tax=Armadillidium nasatum TaxID=96803 RepID=A0A5N5T1A7_9CRUS|nr:Periodic tryptophan protein 1-like protein [Armadillidium nasatum]